MCNVSLNGLVAAAGYVESDDFGECATESDNGNPFPVCLLQLPFDEPMQAC